jgi:hypothetical protein
MANYALGYPVVTGCHSVHRLAALEAVGCLAAHDAQDLLVAMRYPPGAGGTFRRSSRGAHPVDWAGYLSQRIASSPTGSGS